MEVKLLEGGRLGETTAVEVAREGAGRKVLTLLDMVIASTLELGIME